MAPQGAGVAPPGVEYSTVQYSTVHYSTVQYGATHPDLGEVRGGVRVVVLHLVRVAGVGGAAAAAHPGLGGVAVQGVVTADKGVVST